MESPELVTERLVLRALRPEDADAVYEACQAPDIPRWTSVPSPYTRDHAAGFVGEISPGGWRDDLLYNFGVFTRRGGVLVGCMGLVGIERLRSAERQAELGYWTAMEHRGRGYTAEAGREVCRWAFATLGAERLEWVAEAGNEGSRAVARKIGFRMEGTLRAKIIHAGTRRDAWTGSLLPSDWGLSPDTPYLPFLGDR